MALKVEDLFEDMVDNLGVPGIAAGIGALVLAPFLIPVVAGVGKPIAKAAIKGGIFAYEKSKGVLAEAGEAWEDIVAEAKAELSEKQAQMAIEEAATHPEVG
ncbi:MAG: DUF5132 domain-containing protein [Symploca sp. SIO3C6]|uniref:DUF5132 domain-containing protein n=1 Tax=Symploca sp. SIO1C4 TaxID=2607765 RepID=A0A6B3MXN2_9CYAN|nr:DUF5132 domain-containing protein [Symploca sp. SIO3C6]NER26186.1 DUF5132 domain-containing protein [Symploca sp. SIO1C4]NET04846.1 DUF5132 domain-containing protein [Symploca sp. SIO2B6]